MGIGRVCRRLAVADDPGGREITNHGLGAGAERRHEGRYRKWTVWFRFTGGGFEGSPWGRTGSGGTSTYAARRVHGGAAMYSILPPKAL